MPISESWDGGSATLLPGSVLVALMRPHDVFDYFRRGGAFQVAEQVVHNHGATFPFLFKHILSQPDTRAFMFCGAFFKEDDASLLKSPADCGEVGLGDGAGPRIRLRTANGCDPNLRVIGEHVCGDAEKGSGRSDLRSSDIIHII